ncbi:myo-inositol transporter [Rhizopus stolonifer]|uniref:Myo-inositol transporter n=1 Tax=Rhizopus stolonifer TaxID=4846 RepID=A0A367J5L4_RHIST|nr:myo-inositol transporter [Rhizopus stolonifer]
MLIENRSRYERIAPNEEEQSIEKLTPFLCSLVFSVCLGGFLFGYDTGVISGALSPLEKDFIMSTRQKEYIVAGTTLGAIFGGLFAGPLSDRFGRKPLVLYASGIFIIGSAMLALADTYNMLLLGRLVVGLGVGMASMIIPVYISEVAPKNFRGRLSTLNTFTVTFGQVMAYIINLIFAQTKGGWRYMFGLGALPALIQLIIMPFMPESPRRMVVVGDIEMAKHTLQKIYGCSVTDEFISREIEAIQQDMQHTSLGNYRDFLKPENFKPLRIACMLQSAQQLSGFNTVMYYAATILKMANFQDPTAVALVVAIANMVFTVVAILVIDKRGRRPVLIITMLSMILSLIALGGSFALQQQQSTKCLAKECDGPVWISIILLVSLTCYVASYALGLGYIPWIIQGELFTLQLRGKANGIATATNWICNLIAASTFLSMTNLLSAAGTFWFYALVSGVLWIFITKSVPEVKTKQHE